jgi:alanine dehydrogenase
MSEVAGRLSIQSAAYCLQRSNGGIGLLLGGVPGVAPATVLIIGGGVVGSHAAWIASGLGADTIVMDQSLPRLRALTLEFNHPVRTVFSTQYQLERLLPYVDVVVGAVLIPGAAAPKLISKDMLSLMRPGSVLIDVAIDQGGCFETSRPTTHSHPTYVENGMIHYCVANMPSAVPRTSTLALNHATLPYILKLAAYGLSALEDDPGLKAGLNIYDGNITCKAVAEALTLPYHDLNQFNLLGSRS